MRQERLDIINKHFVDIKMKVKRLLTNSIKSVCLALYWLRSYSRKDLAGYGLTKEDLNHFASVIKRA
jgi:retron-type reverse transcriptase